MLYKIFRRRKVKYFNVDGFLNAKFKPRFPFTAPLHDAFG